MVTVFGDVSSAVSEVVFGAELLCHGGVYAVIVLADEFVGKFRVHGLCLRALCDAIVEHVLDRHDVFAFVFVVWVDAGAVPATIGFPFDEVVFDCDEHDGGRRVDAVDAPELDATHGMPLSTRCRVRHTNRVLGRPLGGRRRRGF